MGLRFLVLVALAAGLAACGDLFHGTDWASRCDADPRAPGCGSGGGATTTTSAGGGGSATTSSSSGTASSSSGTTSSSGGGAGGAPTDAVGCADGQREGFVDLVASPKLAACSGGFDVPGIVAPEPACNHGAGDDGGNPSGAGCSAADLCSLGWHPCASAAEVGQLGGCAAIGLASGDVAFYATGQSGPGAGACGAGDNDVFGCGTLGAVPDPLSCAPLDRFSSDLCVALGAPWSCGLDNLVEALAVVKPGPGGGGVLCCRM